LRNLGLINYIVLMLVIFHH